MRFSHGLFRLQFISSVREITLRQESFKKYSVIFSRNIRGNFVCFTRRGLRVSFKLLTLFKPFYLRVIPWLRRIKVEMQNALCWFFQYWTTYLDVGLDPTFSSYGGYKFWVSWNLCLSNLVFLHFAFVFGFVYAPRNFWSHWGFTIIWCVIHPSIALTQRHSFRPFCQSQRALKFVNFSCFLLIN